MGKHRKNEKFSNVWMTQTQLGEYFRLSAKEVGQKLVELGLRTYDTDKRVYIPTERALTEGFCTSTPLKNGTPFYMWHKQKVSNLLQEKTAMQPLSEKDVEHRGTALDLIQVLKDADEGYDKLAYLFFDSISSRDLPAVWAWALIEAQKESNKTHRMVVDGVSAKEFPAVNRELERLGSDIRLEEVGSA